MAANAIRIEVEYVHGVGVRWRYESQRKINGLRCGLQGLQRKSGRTCERWSLLCCCRKIIIIIVNSLIEEIHSIFSEVSFVKRKYTCETLIWCDKKKNSCERISAKRIRDMALFSVPLCIFILSLSLTYTHIYNLCFSFDVCMLMM